MTVLIVIVGIIVLMLVVGSKVSSSLDLDKTNTRIAELTVVPEGDRGFLWKVRCFCLLIVGSIQVLFAAVALGICGYILYLLF